MPREESRAEIEPLQFQTFAKASSGGKIEMDGVRFIGDFRAEKFAEATDAGEISMVGAQFYPTPKQRRPNALMATVISLLVAVVGGVIVAWLTHSLGLNS